MLTKKSTPRFTDHIVFRENTAIGNMHPIPTPGIFKRCVMSLLSFDYVRVKMFNVCRPGANPPMGTCHSI